MRSSTTSPDEVTASPRASRLPDDCPTFGSRPDRHDYDGVHHELWWSATGVRSAVYAPDAYPDPAVAAGLARALAEIEAFDGPEDSDLRVEQLDMSVDDEGITGPGRMFASRDDGGGLPTERQALAQATVDLRRRLHLPEQG